MKRRGQHEIYQDNMVLAMYGFPQFSADPAGNKSLLPSGKVEIGDLGYFRSVS